MHVTPRPHTSQPHAPRRRGMVWASAGLATVSVLWAVGCTPTAFRAESAAVSRAAGSPAASCSTAKTWSVVVVPEWMEPLPKERHFVGNCTAGGIRWLWHTEYFGGIRADNDMAGVITVAGSGGVRLLVCGLNQPAPKEPQLQPLRTCAAAKP